MARCRQHRPVDREVATDPVGGDEIIGAMTRCPKERRRLRGRRLGGAGAEIGAEVGQPPVQITAGQVAAETCRAVGQRRMPAAVQHGQTAGQAGRSDPLPHAPFRSDRAKKRIFLRV